AFSAPYFTFVAPALTIASDGDMPESTCVTSAAPPAFGDLENLRPLLDLELVLSRYEREYAAELRELGTEYPEIACLVRWGIAEHDARVRQGYPTHMTNEEQELILAM